MEEIGRTFEFLQQFKKIEQTMLYSKIGQILQIIHIHVS